MLLAAVVMWRPRWWLMREMAMAMEVATAVEAAARR